MKKRIFLCSLVAAAIVGIAYLADAVTYPNPPPYPPIPSTYYQNFSHGDLFFDDAVGVYHIRQSGSTAETDYAPGVAAPGGLPFYARLLVQPNLATGTACSNGNTGINCDQSGPCTPGAAESVNNFSCGGPFTEWGLPFGGYDGAFDTGIPIQNGGVDSVDIYLDTSFAATARNSGGSTDYRFDWDSDLLDSKGMFLQDYIFNVGTGQNTDSCAPASGGFYVVEASTNSQRSGANAHNPTPPNPPQVCISTPGWYTFTHVITADRSYNLQVVMTITTTGYNHLVASWTLHPTCLSTQAGEGLCSLGSPVPFSAVGAGFLGWFPDQEINDLTIDNISRNSIPR
jgi:hypothetical protein